MENKVNTVIGDEIECEKCHTKVNTFVVISQTEIPVRHKGSFNLCGHCGHLSIFEDNNILRSATIEDLVPVAIEAPVELLKIFFAKDKIQNGKHEQGIG